MLTLYFLFYLCLVKWEKSRNMVGEVGLLVVYLDRLTSMTKMLTVCTSGGVRARVFPQIIVSN